jgi:homospermidine synthase
MERTHFPGTVVMVGFGSIGQAVLPLLARDLGIGPQRITIVAPRDQATAVAGEFGASLVRHRLTRENHRAVLEPLLAAGDFLLNLSVDVASLALIELCQRQGALYLDTCIEPWPGGYTDPAAPAAARTNYALREAVLAHGRAHPGAPTAIVTQGANPGLVSAFVKQALLNVAADSGIAVNKPLTPEDWALLACDLGIRAIHIAERDTQTAARRKARGEFVNTWSVPAFVSEGLQPAELGWGTHERHWPADAARHASGCQAAIYLNRPGAATRVRSWTPLEGAYHGFLITHGESISIADHLTLREGGETFYRPTVHYAYHPCDDAVLSLHELAGRQWRLQHAQRILRDEIDSGVDEMGVLLLGHPRGVYWYGSRLSIEAARRLAPYNNATSLQVAAGVLAGMAWALRHPAAGVVEPDDLDYARALDVARPYLGELVGAWGDWTPLAGRGWPFDEAVDRDDPWQFINVRVA